MNHFTLRRPAAWAVLVALGMLAVVAGCSKRITHVDTGYTSLEGRPDPNSRMLAWYDTPETISVWLDLETPGPSPDPDHEPDFIIARPLTYRTAPGVIHTEILDKTPASGFQFYRTANNGGLQAITDFPVAAAVKWLSSGWELYTLLDQRPSSYAPPTYVGRGLLDGLITTSSPLTNPAIASLPLPRATIDWIGTRTPTDSLFQMQWTQVNGAAGYWLNVYQFKTIATLEERRSSGTPAPVLDGNVDHFFVGYMAGASNTSYKLGDPGPEVLTFKAPLLGQAYFARVTAVDANGNVVAWMRGDSLINQMQGTYERYPVGAAIISPHR